MPPIIEPLPRSSPASDLSAQKTTSSSLTSQEVVSALESYFQETALTQQMPLPRWAVW